MLWSPEASALRSLHLCLMVYLSLMFGTSQAFNDISEGPCIFKTRFRNFRLILSWELKNESIVPTQYTLWYTIMSKPEEPKIVESCTNIMRTSCDLTDLWQDVHETYIPILEVAGGSGPLARCFGSFLATNMSFEPPEFEIIGFTNHINVTMEFPSVPPKIYGKEIQYYLSLIVQEHSEMIVKTHKPQINGDVSGNFSYIIDNLFPNTNYCISVYFEPKVLGSIIKSPLKCTLLPPAQESGSSESAKIGGIITVFLVAVISISIIITLKRLGYICLKNNIPKVLIFRNFFAWVFPEPPPTEAVDTVEIISVYRKKKVWDYNYDDESDSDNEAAPRTSAAGYTMHGLTGRLLSHAPASSAISQESTCKDSDAEESEEPEAVAEQETPPVPRPCPCQSEGPSERYGSKEHLLQDPLPSDSGSSMGPAGDRIIFNVDLNSVFLSALHDDSEEASEEAAQVSSLAEEMVDLTEDPHGPESGLLMASGERTQPPHPRSSPQCLWTEDAPSDSNDTSDSDDFVGDGYIMR